MGVKIDGDVFAENIKLAMQRSGITSIQKLIESSKIPERSIYNYLGGHAKRAPKDEYLEALAKVLQTTPSSLLGAAPPTTPPPAIPPPRRVFTDEEVAVQLQSLPTVLAAIKSVMIMLRRRRITLGIGSEADLMVDLAHRFIVNQGCPAEQDALQLFLSWVDGKGRNAIASAIDPEG